MTLMCDLSENPLMWGNFTDLGRMFSFAMMSLADKIHNNITKSNHVCGVPVFGSKKLLVTVHFESS